MSPLCIDPLCMILLRILRFRIEILTCMRSKVSWPPRAVLVYFVWLLIGLGAAATTLNSRRNWYTNRTLYTVLAFPSQATLVRVQPYVTHF